VTTGRYRTAYYTIHSLYSPAVERCKKHCAMINYPEIRDMQLLVALAQRKHFTQAAADCGISQPAFSARVRNLERQLGVPIVRRGNKFLGFTREGELILRWGRKILANAEGLRQEIAESKGQLAGVLVLGVVPTALPYAADVATALHSRHEKLTLRIQSLTAAQITRGLNDFSIDAGITYREESETGMFRFNDLYKERYVLLCPAHLAPRQSGVASWAEASQVPLCLLNKDMRFRQIVDEVFKRAGVAPEPIMETNAFTAALAQVTNGSAATIAPQKLIDGIFLDRGSVTLALEEPAIDRTISLVTLETEFDLPAIGALFELVDIPS